MVYFIYDPYCFSLPAMVLFNTYRVWFLIDARRRGKLPAKGPRHHVRCASFIDGRRKRIGHPGL